MRIEVSPSQVKAAFERVQNSDAYAQSRRLAEAGMLPVEMLQAMALRPEILDVLSAIGPAAYPGGMLERSLKELVILESSRTNECQFCTQSHRAMMRALEMGEEPLQLLDEKSGRSERELLALEYTREAMRDSNAVSDELFARLKAQFSDAEIVELTFLVGMIGMLNLFNNCLQVRYHDDYAKVKDAAAR